MAFKKYGFKNRALRDADVQWRTLKLWMQEDKAFADAMTELFDETQSSWKDELEEAGIKRAVNHSDNLLKFFLSKLDPSYREKSDLNITGSVAIRENVELSEL